MDFPPANGWCSTSCRSLSTFFTRTSAGSTASKTYGATRPGYNGKRRRLADQRFLDARLRRFPRLLIEATESDLLRLPGGRNRHNYFGDGEDGGLPFVAAGDVAPCAAGAGGGLASISSTSKISVALGPISGVMERSPYARFDGIHN